MKKWTGGTIAQGLVDEYPLPPLDPTVDLSPADIQRWLGITLSAKEIKELLEKLEFEVKINKDLLSVKTPSHRLDIGEGMIGRADLMEEIARIYGYDQIPETNLADGLPDQVGNRSLELEEMIRDSLVGLGLQEIVTYRITSPEAESKALPPDMSAEPRIYLEITNPISSDKTVMRQDLLASVLDVVEKNHRNRNRIALFELGPEFLLTGDNSKINEQKKLVVCLSGSRAHGSWQNADREKMDYFDLKGLVEGMLDELHIVDYSFQPDTFPKFHPGKTARLERGGETLGILGEIHPMVKKNYRLPDKPVAAAILDLDKLMQYVDDLYAVEAIPDQPPVLEDLALVVDEDVPAQDVEALIKQTGGAILRQVRLFDIYRGDQLGEGKKSLAYSLVYQDAEKTLTDKEVLAVRNKIVKRLEKKLGAQLRSW